MKTIGPWFEKRTGLAKLLQLKFLLPAFWLALCFSPQRAEAYLDPATGGMLFTATLGVLTTLFYLVRTALFKASNLRHYFGARIKTEQGKRHSVVIYSEGGQYWDVFQPIIKNLVSKGVSLQYISGSKDDPGLKFESELIHKTYIGNTLQSFFFLNTLQADLVVMTTPGLDVLHLRRSKSVKRYCHVTHSAGGCAGYTAFGVDYYDHVLVGGVADKVMIEELESKRNLPPKDIRIVGCTYLDAKRQRLATLKKVAFFDNSKKTILISPTWGHGILSTSGEMLLRNLTETGDFNLIVRPHPHSMVVEKSLMEKLQNLFPNGPQLRWDLAHDNLNAMAQSDLMISDFSGIIYDYLFLFQKPILAFNTQYNKKGKDAGFLDEDPWNVKMIHQIGKSLTIEDLPALHQHATEALNAATQLAEVIDQAKQDMDQFENRSGQVAANAIIEILDSIQHKEQISA